MSHAMDHSMNQAANQSMSGAGDRPRADRALRWIGDLDHPFYSDERNRYVWYEASAIAFQMLHLGITFTAGAVLLVAGGPAIPYVMAMFFPLIVTSVVFQGYLTRHSAEYWPVRRDMTRPRGRLVVVAVLVVLAGMVRATLDLQSRTLGGAFSGTSLGILAAVIIAFLGGFAWTFWEGHKAEQAEELDEF